MLCYDIFSIESLSVFQRSWNSFIFRIFLFMKKQQILCISEVAEYDFLIFFLRIFL